MLWIVTLRLDDEMATQAIVGSKDVDESQADLESTQLNTAGVYQVHCFDKKNCLWLWGIGIK